MLETGDAARPYRLDLEGMERAFMSGVKAYLMSSPHNPLGHTSPATSWSPWPISPTGRGCSCSRTRSTRR